MEKASNFLKATTVVGWEDVLPLVETIVSDTAGKAWRERALYIDGILLEIAKACLGIQGMTDLTNGSNPPGLDKFVNSARTILTAALLEIDDSEPVENPYKALLYTLSAWPRHQLSASGWHENHEEGFDAEASELVGFALVVMGGSEPGSEQRDFAQSILLANVAGRGKPN